MRRNQWRAVPPGAVPGRLVEKMSTYDDLSGWIEKFVLPTKQDAQEFIDKHCAPRVAGIYYLHHGEYSAPEFKPRKYMRGWGVHAEYSYYQGTYNAPTSGALTVYDAEQFVHETRVRTHYALIDEREAAQND